MTRVRLLAVLLCPAVASQATTADLRQIERRISKEPSYQTKAPTYCLLVLGPKADARVWLVLDGDRLYVDRNGNGDLTETGEEFRVAETFKYENEAYAEARQFAAGALVEAGGRAKHTELEVGYFVPNANYRPVTRRDRDMKEFRDKNAGRTMAVVSLKLGGRVRQVAAPVFATTPANAPVVHFNGPLAMGLLPEWLYGRTVLTRGAASKLTVVVGSPGLGEGSFAQIAYDDMPKTASPVAEITFPAKAPWAAPLRMTVPLSHRC